MTTSPTVAQLSEISDTESMKAHLLALLEAAGGGIDPTAWPEDAALRAMVHAMAAFHADRTRITSLLARGRYLDDAEGDWLTILVKSDYDLERYEPVATVGIMTLTADSTASLPQSIAVGELVVVDTATGATFRNTTAGTISTALTPVEFTWQSEASGPAANIPDDSTTLELVTPIPGVFPDNPPGTGSWITVQGASMESDESLRERARSKWASINLSGAVADAYVYLARTADPAVNRVQVSPDTTGTGLVGVYVASEGGAPTASVVTNVTQYVNGNASDPYLPRLAPIGATVTVSAATPRTVVVYLDIVGEAAYADTIEADVLAALDAYFVRVPIGGTKVVPWANDGFVLLAELYKAAMAVPGTINVGISVAVGDAIGPLDHPIALGEVAVPSYTVASVTVV